MVSISIILSATFLALIVYIFSKLLLRTNRTWWKKRGVPSLQYPNLLSRIFIKSSLVEFDGELYKQCTGGYGGFLEFFSPMLLVKDLDLAKSIYVKDFDHFINRRKINMADQFFEDMLVNKRDKDWKGLRATMSPTFTTGKIRRMFPIMNDSSKKLISHLEEVSKENGLVDFEDALGRYALNVISTAAFGIESQAFHDKDSIVARMAQKINFKPSPLLILKFALSMLGKSVGKIMDVKLIDEEAGEFFGKIIRDSVKHRESSQEERNDFLQLMIEAKNGQLKLDNENEEIGTYDKDAQFTQEVQKTPVDDKTIVSNCVLFILAGFDTTVAVLSFGAYALAMNTEIQEKLRRYLQEATEHTDGQLNYDIINKLDYLDKVVNEILRMYPPGLRTERQCKNDYILPNKSVLPKDALIGIPVYQIHHDEKHFPNPEVFDPERFSPEEKAKRHPYAFMPFGHGPRNCIAMRFALMETKAAFANLVLNFELEPCQKTTIPMEFAKSVTLKPANGMWLKMKPRTN